MDTADKISFGALGSGSRGNAFILRCGQDAVLIDAGFSRRELCARLVKLGIDPGMIRAVLVTHEHEDHVKGMRVLCEQFDIPAYGTGRTMEHLRKHDKLPSRVRLFEPGSCFEIASFEISPFAIPHDAVDPVGFVIRCGGRKIGIATDLGKINPLTSMRLADSDALVLESNYDHDMLMNSSRTMQLKRRIRGQFGHLNNMDAVSALPSLLGARTRALLFAHVSSECNTYETVFHLGRSALDGMGRQDVFFDVVKQDDVLPLLHL